MNGKFITLEGGEGAGKSSSVEFLRQHIERAGHPVITTREPGGTELAEAIREVLLAEHPAGMPPITELLLMFAARSAHIEQRIIPALDAGRWVVCDRFTDASYAYQGAARGLGAEAVAILEHLVQQDLRPDRVLLFDLPVATGLARTRTRGNSNRFDTEQTQFHEKVRQAYLARADEAPGRYRCIDAAASVDDVQCQLVAAMEDLL